MYTELSCEFHCLVLNPLKPLSLNNIKKFSSNLKQSTTFLQFSWSMHFRKIIAVYPNNHTKLIHTHWQNTHLLIGKSGGTYSYH
jgi:hypothetical protein